MQPSLIEDHVEGLYFLHRCGYLNLDIVPRHLGCFYDDDGNIRGSRIDESCARLESTKKKTRHMKIGYSGKSLQLFISARPWLDFYATVLKGVCFSLSSGSLWNFRAMFQPSSRDPCLMDEVSCTNSLLSWQSSRFCIVLSACFCIHFVLVLAQALNNRNIKSVALCLPSWLNRSWQSNVVVILQAPSDMLQLSCWKH